MKNLITIIVIAVTCTVMVSGCGREPVPYESNILDFYRRNSQVEVIIESVHINNSLGKDSSRKMYQDRLDNFRKIRIEVCQSSYDKAKKDYDSNIRKSDKNFYRPLLQEAKKNLEEAKLGVLKDNLSLRYQALVNNPPLIDYFTLRYRTHEGGPIKIQDFYTEILDGDTTIKAQRR